MIAATENTLASERYNAVDLLRSISPHIKGGGGGRPTFAQGGGSHPDGLDDALDVCSGSAGRLITTGFGLPLDQSARRLA